MLKRLVAVSVYMCFGMFVAAFFLSCSTANIYADSPIGWNDAKSATFRYWIDSFSIQPDNIQSLVVNRTFSTDKVQREVYPLAITNRIYGINISGSLQLNSETSLIRVILVDNDLNEHLVYETYPLIVTTNSYSIENVCEETCFLEPIIPRSLKLELINSSIQIDELSVLYSPAALSKGMQETQKQIKDTQNRVRINSINNQIKKRGLKWTVGETPISQLPYAEKKTLFLGTPGDRILNTQGFEYYKGGIFEKIQDTLDTNGTLETERKSSEESSLIESFDWRNRHGANDPASPYYDGDTMGSGWITPVKRQRCNHCWAFAPVHATEAIVNLYFNQHLDLDLSEQNIASCSGGNIGCCAGGFIGTALNYIIETGAVNEECFPYAASCESCANKCSNPNEQIIIGGKLDPGYSEEDIKRAIIKYGPITAGISSWWHYMVMVGFDRDSSDGKTIWIFKNSFGTGWGDNGYGNVKVDLSDLYGKHALLTPVTSLITPYEIACNDKDGDGYYNWGISEEKPSSCPDCPPERDCDDSNPNLGPFDSNGNCVEIVNEFVTFEPDPSTYEFTPNGSPTEELIFSDDFERSNIGGEWITGAFCDSDTITIVDGRVQATENCNFIETVREFSGNLRIEVGVEKNGSSDHGCWDFGVLLNDLDQYSGIIRFDSGGVDGVAIGPVQGCGDDVTIPSGVNKGKAIFTYQDGTVGFSFENDDGVIIDAGSVNAGNFDSSRIRIHLAAHSDTPRYVDNIKVYSINGACPKGYSGKFSFDATLTNISEKELSNIYVEVDELTNENLLLNNEGLLGEGERFEILKFDDYSDGYLSPDENVDVPFNVCLNNTDPFRFFVDVFGAESTWVSWNWLGDIPPTSVSVGWDKYRVDESWYQPGFDIAGIHYEQGIFTHAPAHVTYNLEESYSAFSACIGLDDGDNSCGDGVIFRVNADEIEIYKSDIIISAQPVTCFNLPINGSTKLELFVDELGSNGCDESAWVNAKLKKTEDGEIHAPAPVAKSGQTTSYGKGDDGELQKGVAWPIPRFTDNGDGTITDNLTHLIWDKNANRFGFRKWNTALSDCNNLADGASGLTDGSVAGDWRLANVKEYQSLIHYGVGGPVVPDTLGSGQWSQGDPFNNVKSTDYWSSSTTRGSNNAWVVAFSLGWVDIHSKRSNAYGWCVRGMDSKNSKPVAPVEKTGQTTSYGEGDDGDLERGVAWPIPRFTDNGDGTITDNLTHLIWDKDANRFGQRTWSQALTDCNGLAAADYGDLTDGSVAGDWRLANVKEYQSLIHYGVSSPAVPDTLGTGQWSQGDPFNNVQSYDYWSSTTQNSNKAKGWVVPIGEGYVDAVHYSWNAYDWCVRDGQ